VRISVNAPPKTFIADPPRTTLNSQTPPMRTNCREFRYRAVSVRKNSIGLYLVPAPFAWLVFGKCHSINIRGSGAID
jgi:hypothetical protein